MPSAPASGRGEYVFPLKGFSPGEYELRARLEGGPRKVSATARFRYPEQSVVVPSPAKVRVGSLPRPKPAPRCAVRVTPGGGAVVTVSGRSFAVESTFSVPGGGANRLVCAGSTDHPLTASPPNPPL